MYKMHWYYLNSIYYIRKRVPYCKQQNQAHMVLDCTVCRSTTPKIKCECSISGGRNRGWWISGGSCGGQRKPTNPKTSANARFRCGWGWVIGCGGCGWPEKAHNHQKRATNAQFRGSWGRCWWQPEETHNRRKQCALDFGGYGGSWWQQQGPEKAHNH